MRGARGGGSARAPADQARWGAPGGGAPGATWRWRSRASADGLPDSETGRSGPIFCLRIDSGRPKRHHGATGLRASPHPDACGARKAPRRESCGLRTGPATRSTDPRNRQRAELSRAGPPRVARHGPRTEFTAGPPGLPPTTCRRPPLLRGRTPAGSPCPPARPSIPYDSSATPPARPGQRPESHGRAGPLAPPDLHPRSSEPAGSPLGQRRTGAGPPPTGRRLHCPTRDSPAGARRRPPGRHRAPPRSPPARDRSTGLPEPLLGAAAPRRPRPSIAGGLHRSPAADRVR